MAENRRGKENRFYYTRGQMVLLGGSFTLAAIVIFFLGMFVGKSVEERKIFKQEEPLVRIPVKPEGGAQKKDEVTFNNPETKSAAAPSAEPETKAKEKAPEKIAIAEAPAPKPVEKKVEKIAIEPAPKKAEPASAESGDQTKPWRAQVNAFPDERSAIQLVDRLKNKGYNAYVSEVQNRGKTWYRVSVGRFANREEADKIVEALRSKEDFPKAFAATK